MKIQKYKAVYIFFTVILILCISLGLCVHHYAKIYESKDAVYIKRLPWILPLTYTYLGIENAEEPGCFTCYDNDSVSILDADGKVIRKNSMNRLQMEETLEKDTYSPYDGEFSGGFAPFVSDDGKHFGYINRDNEVVVEAIFTYAMEPNHGLAAVCYMGDANPQSLIRARWGIIDLREVDPDVK